MTNETIAKAKADTKKAVSDLENKLEHVKIDVKAGAEKAKANVENKLAHAKVDAEKAKADIGKEMTDALK